MIENEAVINKHRAEINQELIKHWQYLIEHEQYSINPEKISQGILRDLGKDGNMALPHLIKKR